MNIDAMFASPWGALAIFCLRIVDVSCDTMRVIFAIRGKRGIAAMLGFIQALVWIFAVANAVKHLDSILHVHRLRRRLRDGRRSSACRSSR